MILDDIIDKKKISLEKRKKIISEDLLKRNAFKLVNDSSINSFKNALSKKGLSVIGEFKKASPSKGVIVEDFNIDEICKYYDEIGVDAFSVLTEEDFFLGKDEYLKKIKSSMKNPILRKDFIIDFYQIYESKVLGADAVLLIVSVLKEKLKEFYEETKRLNLDALVEVHNEDELKIAIESGCQIIGINNRNLKTFKTSLEKTKELIDMIPKDRVLISESGISTIEDLKNLEKLGLDAVLVGEMFMRNINNNDFKNEYKDFKNGSC